MNDIEIVPAPSLVEVRRLLGAEGLPASDLDEAMLAHFCAGRRDGALAGIVGLERCGEDGLLRSLVVRPAARGAGLGRVLVAEAERRATDLGIGTLYLLTTTAEAWFRNLGYRACPRESAPPAVRASREFAGLCPGDAAFMSKHLVERST